ncbi:MAG TPA: hypothetical protein VM450_12595 [Thermomicrobiales bacterium]|nr:hypothetical protein [Thermomicrobiales bacterium]
MPHRRALVFSVMITLLVAVATVAAADRYLGNEDPPPTATITTTSATTSQGAGTGQADNAPLLDLLNGVTGNGETTGAYVDDHGDEHDDHDSERDHDDDHDD